MILSVFALGLMAGCDKDEGSNNVVNTSDQVFIMKASMANFAEITAGQIAADSAEDASIAQYGQLMVTEHTAAQQQLSTIATSLGLTISNTLDAEHQMLIDSLFDLDGSAFDSVYIHSQVRDHEATVRFFKNESGNGLQKDIKAYMFQVLPMVTLHLQSARILSQNF